MIKGTTLLLLSLITEASQVTCDRQAVCSGSTVTCTCITGNSDSLSWMSNGNTLSFTSTDAVPMRQNVSGSNQFAVLTENSDVNGIRVIMSNFTINVSSDVSDIILTCENVDHAMIEPIIIPVTPYGECYMHTLQLYCPDSRRTVPIFLSKICCCPSCFNFVTLSHIFTGFWAQIFVRMSHF